MARYGDLDKVLELVNEVNEDGNFTSYAHYSYLFDSIDKLPTIEQTHWTPCDWCKYNPPSSMDGKPCTICPAVGRERLLLGSMQI